MKTRLTSTLSSFLSILIGLGSPVMAAYDDGRHRKDYAMNYSQGGIPLNAIEKTPFSRASAEVLGPGAQAREYKVVISNVSDKEVGSLSQESSQKIVDNGYRAFEDARKALEAAGVNLGDLTKALEASGGLIRIEQGPEMGNLKQLIFQFLQSFLFGGVTTAQDPLVAAYAGFTNGGKDGEAVKLFEALTGNLVGGNSALKQRLEEGKRRGQIDDLVSQHQNDSPSLTRSNATEVGNHAPSAAGISGETLNDFLTYALNTISVGRQLGEAISMADPFYGPMNRPIRPNDGVEGALKSIAIEEGNKLMYREGPPPNGFDSPKVTELQERINAANKIVGDAALDVARTHLEAASTVFDTLASGMDKALEIAKKEGDIKDLAKISDAVNDLTRQAGSQAGNIVYYMGIGGGENLLESSESAIRGSVMASDVMSGVGRRIASSGVAEPVKNFAGLAGDVMERIFKGTDGQVVGDLMKAFSSVFSAMTGNLTGMTVLLNNASKVIFPPLSGSGDQPGSFNRLTQQIFGDTWGGITDAVTGTGREIAHLIGSAREMIRGVASTLQDSGVEEGRTASGLMEKIVSSGAKAVSAVGGDAYRMAQGLAELGGEIVRGIHEVLKGPGAHAPSWAEKLLADYGSDVFGAAKGAFDSTLGGMLNALDKLISTGFNSFSEVNQSIRQVGTGTAQGLADMAGNVYGKMTEVFIDGSNHAADTLGLLFGLGMKLFGHGILGAIANAPSENSASALTSFLGGIFGDSAKAVKQINEYTFQALMKLMDFGAGITRDTARNLPALGASAAADLFNFGQTLFDRASGSVENTNQAVHGATDNFLLMATDLADQLNRILPSMLPQNVNALAAIFANIAHTSALLLTNAAGNPAIDMPGEGDLSYQVLFRLLGRGGDFFQGVLTEILSGSYSSSDLKKLENLYHQNGGRLDGLVSSQASALDRFYALNNGLAERFFRTAVSRLQSAHSPEELTRIVEELRQAYGAEYGRFIKGANAEFDLLMKELSAPLP